MHMQMIVLLWRCQEDCMPPKALDALPLRGSCSCGIFSIKWQGREKGGSCKLEL